MLTKLRDFWGLYIVNTYLDVKCFFVGHRYEVHDENEKEVYIECQRCGIGINVPRIGRSRYAEKK